MDSEAYAGRPGPVFIDIPMDIMMDAVDEKDVVDPGMYRTRGKVYGDFKLVEEAARLLSGAQRPAILAGSQVWHCRGVAELEELAGKLGCPVYCNGEARGALPKDSPIHFEHSRHEAFERAEAGFCRSLPRARAGNGGAREPAHNQALRPHAGTPDAG